MVGRCIGRDLKKNPRLSSPGKSVDHKKEKRMVEKIRVQGWEHIGRKVEYVVQVDEQLRVKRLLEGKEGVWPAYRVAQKGLLNRYKINIPRRRDRAQRNTLKWKRKPGRREGERRLERYRGKKTIKLRSWAKEGKHRRRKQSPSKQEKVSRKKERRSGAQHILQYLGRSMKMQW